MASGTVQTGLIAKVQINNETAQRIASTAYGVCNSAANEAAKVVQIDGFELITGVTIYVKFTNDNTATNPPTLNVNGTGAINIVQYGAVAAGVTSETSGWQAGAIVSLTYDGTYWVRDQGYNTNTTYSTVSTSAAGLVPQANTVSTQSQSTKFLREDGSWEVPSYSTKSSLGLDNVTNHAQVTSIAYDTNTGVLSYKVSEGTANTILTLGSNAFNSTSYLPLSGGIMTGNIRRYYSAASTQPMITALSNNRDIYLWEIGHGSVAATTSNSNHYKLMYKGTGAESTNSNYLQLIAHHSSDLVAVQINEIGIVSLPQMTLGSATKPIYLNTNGEITEGTQIGASAYHDDSYFSTSDHVHGNITNDGKMEGSTITVGATVTTSHKFLREDGTWVVPKYTTNTNTATRQQIDSSRTGKYSLLQASMVIGTATNTSAYSTYRSDNIYAEPSTGTIYAEAFNNLTLTKETIGFTISGGTTSKTLTVTNSYTLGAACEKGVITDFTNNTTSTNLPTTAAVVSYVSGLGYTDNTGTLTSITIKTSSPLTGGSNTAATTTGTWTIGFETQSANTIFAGPSNGNDATPTFRSLVAADLPTVTVAKGGTNKTSWTQYAIPYLSATTTFGEIAPNKTTTTKFLSMTGSGTAGDTPEWVTLSADDIPNISWNKITSDKPTTLEGYGIENAATDDHVHGNIGNDGTLGGNNIANRLVYTDSNQLIDITGHYASSSKVAINSTSEPDENFYVSGTIQFNIGTNDGTSQEKFIIYGNSRYLSLGGQGIQAYSSSNTATLYLQSNGGNLIIGSSSTTSATRSMYGKFDFKSSGGFTFSSMGTASSLNIYRPLWIMGASSSSSLTNGYPVSNENLAFNTSTNTLKIGSGTITATNYSGTAAQATADADGNTITTTYAPLASPALTGTPTAPTAANNTNDTQIATTAFVYNTLNVANAMLFKGTIGAGGTINTTADPAETLPSTHEAGWTYKVITAGTYAGMVCEVGDLIICVEDGTQDSNSDWTSVQVNDEGLVVGPASVTDNAIARFDGITGKVIQESNVTIDDNGKITAPHTQSKTDGIHFTYGSNINFFVGVGSGNTNHGIYDTKASKWVLSATASNHNWTLNGNAATATQWASAQTVYVTLGTASTATTIQGGSSSAQTIGVDGTLAVTNGGTGTATAPTQGGLIYGSSTTAYACTSAGTSGQVIISKGTDTPEWYTGLTLLSTTTESNDTSITTYEAIFGGTVTATTYYGALEQRSSTDNVARSVWFSYYDNNAVQDGVLAKDSDFTYNPSTNVLSIGTLTITGGTTNSALSSTGELSISSGTNKVMSINSGSTLTLDSATNTAITFSKNGTAAWSFIADGTAIQPETSGAINLGSTTNRWGALYVGSSDDYGDEYTPVYWNNGLPTASYPVQYFTWTINSGKTGVVLTHDALTEDTFPLTIVVTSGEEDLTGPITWNNAKSGNNNQFELSIPSALPSGKTVSGYCIVAHGTAITPTSTDIPSSNT